MFAKLFALAVLGASAQSVVAGCLKEYTIKDGDYCDLISQTQSVSTYQLAALNQGKINNGCSNLQPGDTLCLAEDAKENCETTYTVQGGDDCFDIANKNALNMTILYLNNPQIDEACSNIYVGEVLCTSQTVQAPPIPSSGVALPAPNASSTTLVQPAATPAPAPVVASPAPVVASPAPAPAVSSSAAAPKASAPAPSAASAADEGDDAGDDDDDENLPFCDEM